MPSTKRLRSIAHSIGHHSVSGLSYIHPHLGERCGALSLSEASVNLLDGTVSLPEPLPKFDPLALASRALHKRFIRLLESENVEAATLREASIMFQFIQSKSWPDGCYVRMTTHEGVVLEEAVASDGTRAEILPSST